MPRYKLTIEYDGTPYHGWQRQHDDFPSVQGHIEQAIAQVTGERVPLHCSGRTDAGVHAMAQVAHVDIDKPIKAFSLMQGINYYLQPEPIVVHHCEEVGDDFHARFDSKRRYYTYRILNRYARLGLETNRMWQVPQPLDIDIMQEAANELVGTHDFSSFRDSECQAKSPIKTLDVLDISEVSTPLGREVLIHTNSKSFLHHQVRIMTGSLVWVGRGKWTIEHIRHALEQKDRTSGGPTAPAEGLYFMGVVYSHST